MLLAWVVLAACSSFDAEGGGADAGGLTDAGADAPPPDGAAEGGADCPGTAGPKGVRVGEYCIDATEVTNAQYEAFLDAKGGDTSGQPSEACSTNTSFVPREWPYPPGDGLYPVRHVDWCDAVAFCAWAGKRLCGRVGGGPLSEKDLTNPDRSQWFRACSAGGAQDYPYGNTYRADAGAGGEARDPDVLAEVGSTPGCEGGYPGVFDMSGNAWEWEDACNGTGPDAGCRIRGGDVSQPQGTLGCGSAITQERFAPGPWGFRCCAP